MTKIYGNRFCEIYKMDTGYIIHSKYGNYPDKFVETLAKVSYQTHIPSNEILKYGVSQ